MANATLPRTACRAAGKGVEQEEIYLRLCVDEDNWKRLRWLAKDLGFRQFENYASNAVRLIMGLCVHQKAGKRFFFGNDPLRAVQFPMPSFRGAPLIPAEGKQNLHEILVRLTPEQKAGLDAVRDGALCEQFLWFALWMYYDLLQDYDAGKRVYVGTKDGPETEINLRPDAAS